MVKNRLQNIMRRSACSIKIQDNARVPKSQNTTLSSKSTHPIHPQHDTSPNEIIFSSSTTPEYPKPAVYPIDCFNGY